MRLISETPSGGVFEQLFTLGEIPGGLWTPEGAAGPRPLTLMGHGGGQHKSAPNIPAGVAGPSGRHPRMSATMKATLPPTAVAARRWFHRVQLLAKPSHWAGAPAAAGSRPARASVSGTLP